MNIVDHLLQTIPRATKLILSIGVSDGIEYYTEPRVHKYHNCPDIMRMKWEKYNCFHAALSGIKVSWHMILTAYMLFPYSEEMTNYLSLVNILIPIAIRLIYRPKSNYYVGHELLYLINSTVLATNAFLIVKRKLMN
jgi:hypothetical protein